MTMITFAQDDVRFTHRIAGVAIEDGRVLLHQAEGDDFWALPGGRAELLEPAQATLRREMREELDIEVEVVRPLWLVENFFQHQGYQHHELGIYFLMRVPADWPYRAQNETFLGDENGTRLIYRWAPVEELASMRVYPSFLAQGLYNLPLSLEHVVHVDT